MACLRTCTHTCAHKLRTLVYDILPSTTAVFSYTIGSRKQSANEQLFVGAQTVVCLLQTIQIISYVCFIYMTILLMPAQIKPKSPELRQYSFFVCLFFTWGGCVSCLRACLGARLLTQSYQYSNLSEGTDRIGGQLRGHKECPFSGVTKSGRVWRNLPESDAVIVTRARAHTHTHRVRHIRIHTHTQGHNWERKNCALRV